MTDEQKEIVRTESFWIDTWLAQPVRRASRRRYIIHDAAAKEVDEDTFYHTRESGGTRISSAYKVCVDLIEEAVAAQRVEHLLLPVLRRRQLGRRQRAEPAAAARRHSLPQVQPVLLRPGRKPLRQRRVHPRRSEARSATNTRTLVLSEIENKEAIYESIKMFLGKGKVTECLMSNVGSSSTNDHQDQATRHQPCPPLPTTNCSRKTWPSIQRQMEKYARDYGLDFFPTIFEVVDYDQLNAVAAYGGFPTRYPHWRFGMEYEQLSKGYSLRPAEDLRAGDQQRSVLRLPAAVSNGITDQKLVMAHVYGHCDFFKNNYWFSQTNRKMIDEMANHGNRIRDYMDRFGVEEVETFIDACLSIEDLIDIHSPFIKRRDDKTRYDFRKKRRRRGGRGPRSASSRPRTTWISSSIRAHGWRRRPSGCKKEKEQDKRFRPSRCAT